MVWKNGEYKATDFYDANLLRATTGNSAEL